MNEHTLLGLISLKIFFDERYVEVHLIEVVPSRRAKIAFRVH